jgi:nicotinamide-nucleotide amidase
MQASIIAVGSEMLGDTRLDTNSLTVTRSLERFGVALARKSVVGDDHIAIAAELRFSLSFSDIVVITGGLGPTEDDLTREGVSGALGLETTEDLAVLEKIEQRFRNRNMRMPDVNRRQARVFVGQKVLPNARGTAPGFHLAVDFGGKPKHVWIFPGVPFELEGMISSELEPWLQSMTHQTFYRRTIKIVGLPESSVEEKILPFYRAHEDEPITILATNAEIQIHLQARGSSDEAYPKLNAMEQEIRQLVGDRFYGVDDDKLESVVGRMLASRGETVATAESCTGGLLASRITDVSGSSAYFVGGTVTYSRESKLFMLGIDPAILDAEGEVCEPVAAAMARGARRRFGTTYGVGITGIAGPTGGTAAKPVGTVFIAVASLLQVDSRKWSFPGSREMVKWFSTQYALDMLRGLIGKN